MTLRALVFLLAALVMLTEPVGAEITPTASARDERIKTLVYREDDVIRLELTYGISTMITFGQDEVVETVSTGDSEALAASPSKDQRILFVKPTADGLRTNLSVTTNTRDYVFFVTADELDGVDPTFKVRIVYPSDEEARRLEETERARRMAVRAEAAARVANPNIQALAKADVNLDYGFRGSGANRPTLVFDDGVKTYFKFADELPAIFAVDRRRNESLVNHRREGDYIVVDGVHAQWTLRSGAKETCLFNLAVPNPGEAGPEPMGPRDLNQRLFPRIRTVSTR